MPGVNLHLVLANRVLQEWSGAPGEAPFDPRNPELVSAFCHGAFGPDLGYFPGADRLLSELAHRVRPADLTRQLVRSARSDTERAFSLGWATHVLGDQLIHPLVGLGVGYDLTGRRDLFVAGAADEVTHLRVETGLDAYYALRGPVPRDPQFFPIFSLQTVEFLTRAFQTVYGVDLGSEAFLRAHHSVCRSAGVAVGTIRFLGRGLFHRTPSRRGLWLLAQTAEILRRHAGREPLALALLTPVRPPGWLVRAVGRIEGSFGRRFQDLVEENFASLPNNDLDSGARALAAPPEELLARIPRIPRLAPPVPAAARTA